MCRVRPTSTQRVFPHRHWLLVSKGPTLKLHCLPLSLNLSPFPPSFHPASLLPSLLFLLLSLSIALGQG